MIRLKHSVLYELTVPYPRLTDKINRRLTGELKKVNRDQRF